MYAPAPHRLAVAIVFRAVKPLGVPLWWQLVELLFCLDNLDEWIRFGGDVE